MILKRLAALIALATLTMGNACVKAPPEIVVVTADQPALAFPPECTSADPPWSRHKDGAISKADPPRIERKNFTNYTEILGKRAVCRAAITAATKRE